MNVPKLRFKEFSNDWKDEKLEDVVDFLDDRRKPIKDSDRNNIKGIYPYYGASGIIDYINDYIFDEELLLLGEDGANILSRSTQLVFKATGKYWVNNHVHVLRPKENYNIDFLESCLENINYEPYNTGTAQPKLNQEVCRKINIKTPSLKEQVKIGKTLSLLDKKIELQTKKIEILKLFKKGLLKCEYNKIKSKNLSQLNNVAQIYQPRTLSQKQLKKGVYPVFGANGIIGFNSNFNHKLPQITISCRGENSGSINKTPEYCWINGNSMVINVDNNPNINKDYLKLILESQNLKYLISGSGQPQIIRSDIAKHKIPIISIDEQLIYIKKFNLLESKLPLEISKLKKLNLLKKGLMQNMFI